jgi:hypothetical protein
MKYEQLFGVFGSIFAVVYFIAVEENIALVTYHPRLNQWAWGTEMPLMGPAMYWYGWIGTAFIAASILTLAAASLFQRKTPPHWIGWSIPLLTIAAFGYSLRGFFIH